ncbi:MAG: hypothetical protein H6936_09425 [Burkholderiales bacterium]|nr:hypothetical protein [Burkholderiales bacterium]
MPIKKTSFSDPLLGIDIVSELITKACRTIRENCVDGKYTGAQKDSTGSWLIPLSSLPSIAQARYWIRNASNDECLVNADSLRKLSEEQEEDLWSSFEESSEKLKQKAYRDAEACLAWQIMKSEGKHFQDALIEIEKEYGIKSTAIYEKFKIVKDYEPKHWPALLIGKWRGENAKRVEWPLEAWGKFIKEMSSPGRKVKAAWDRTKQEADKQRWGKIPSYDTAKSQWNDLEDDLKAALRGELKILKAKSPTAIRKYDQPLHEIWSMDGKKADVIVIDRKGKYGQKNKKHRLWLYAYMESRSRFLLGYALGVSLTSDLLRDAFLHALKTTDRIIPREVQPDSGMEGAAKEITGGAPWRRRGKVKDDEIMGLFPFLGIEIRWVSLAHGQAKPIERFFGTLSGRLETLPEFRGAFCGNSTETRPEEWDDDKAVPVELFERFLDEEISSYNQRPHQGDNMDNRTPLQVYTELMQQPGYIAKRISEAQLRVCTYSSVAITIRRNATFTILGASYWSEGTAKLAPGKGYYARYNPRNLSDTVYVYKGNKLKCEATKKEMTSFNDKAAAKEITQARSKYVKSKKQAAKALQELSGTESRAFLKKLAEENIPENVEQKSVEALPKPKVIEIVKSEMDIPGKKTVEELEHEEIKKEAEKIRKEQSRGLVDSYKNRAITKSKGA